jgi:hypothetical protein
VATHTHTPKKKKKKKTKKKKKLVLLQNRYEGFSWKKKEKKKGPKSSPHYCERDFIFFGGTCHILK